MRIVPCSGADSRYPWTAERISAVRAAPGAIGAAPHTTPHAAGDCGHRRSGGAASRSHRSKTAVRASFNRLTPTPEPPGPRYGTGGVRRTGCAMTRATGCANGSGSVQVAALPRRIRPPRAGPMARAGRRPVHHADETAGAVATAMDSRPGSRSPRLPRPGAPDGTQRRMAQSIRWCVGRIGHDSSPAFRRFGGHRDPQALGTHRSHVLPGILAGSVRCAPHPPSIPQRLATRRDRPAGRPSPHRRMITPFPSARDKLERMG